MSDGSEDIGLGRRTSLAVTISVWKALFLRESLYRLFSGRGAWFWLLAEPVAHVGYLLFIYTVISVHKIGGIDTVMWTMVGLLAFFSFRRPAMQMMNAVDANQALFTYRQVKPVDTVLVRGGLEAVLMVVVGAILFLVAAMAGHDVRAATPLMAMAAFGGLWALSLGFGLIASVATRLVPEFGPVIRVTMMPLYFLSGVLLPIGVVPQPYRDWLLLNPVAHGIEAARAGFAPYYHAVEGMSLAYLFGFALATVFLGLALHRRFAMRLASQ